MMRWNPAYIPGEGRSLLPAGSDPKYRAIPLDLPEGKWALLNRKDYPEIRHDRKSKDGKRVIKKNVLVQHSHCRWSVALWAGTFDSEVDVYAFLAEHVYVRRNVPFGGTNPFAESA